jgi:alpha-1,6-mannosyltransferase
LFNAIEGKSAEWGVSPRHHYFSHLLPRLLLLVYPFSVLALSHPPARWLAGPALSSVALLSSLGHKEWRFVVYIVPLLNTAAALLIVDRCVLFCRSRQLIASRLPRRLVRPTMACILLAALSFSALSTYVSHHNYPGGHAMARLHELYDTPKREYGPPFRAR